MLVGMQLNHTLKICVYLKNVIQCCSSLFPFSWQTLDGSSSLDKWILCIYIALNHQRFISSQELLSLKCCHASQLQIGSRSQELEPFT